MELAYLKMHLFGNYATRRTGQPTTLHLNVVAVVPMQLTTETVIAGIDEPTNKST